MTVHQDCLQCGKCCQRWGWGQKGIVEDLIPWLEEDRRDILQHVEIRFTNGTRVSGREITPADLPRILSIRYWQDTGGRLLRECPFFSRDENGTALCAIHDVKPRVCREFTPWTWQNHEFYGSCPACRDKNP